MKPLLPVVPALSPTSQRLSLISARPLPLSRALCRRAITAAAKVAANVSKKIISEAVIGGMDTTTRLRPHYPQNGHSGIERSGGLNVVSETRGSVAEPFAPSPACCRESRY